jgi:hypothetical protein
MSQSVEQESKEVNQIEQLQQLFNERQSHELSENESIDQKLEEFGGFVRTIQKGFYETITSKEIEPNIMQEKVASALRIVLNKVKEFSSRAQEYQMHIETYARTTVRDMLYFLVSSNTNFDIPDTEKIEVIDKGLLSNNPDIEPLLQLTITVYPGLRDGASALFGDVDLTFPEKMVPQERAEREKVTINVFDEKFEDSITINQIKEFVANNIESVLTGSDTVAINRVFYLLDYDRSLSNELGEADTKIYATKLMERFLQEYVTVDLLDVASLVGDAIITPDMELNASVDLSKIREITNTAGTFDAKSFDLVVLKMLSGNTRSKSDTVLPAGNRVVF